MTPMDMRFMAIIDKRVYISSLESELPSYYKKNISTPYYIVYNKYLFRINYL